MQLLVGQIALNEQDYENALKSFASARALAPFSKLPELDTISLVGSLLKCCLDVYHLLLDVWVGFQLLATCHP